MRNLLEEFMVYYKAHKGRVNGTLIGLVSALLILHFGVFKSLFIALCAFVGYYIGKKFESDRSFIRKILDKILPPGRYR